MSRKQILAYLAGIIIITVIATVLFGDKLGTATAASCLLGLYGLWRNKKLDEEEAKENSKYSDHTPIHNVMVKCSSCTALFPSAIDYGTLQIFQKTISAGNTQRCPNCRSMVRCEESNVTYET